MNDLLATMAAAGLAAAGLGALVRAAPWPAAWLGRKPLSCVACMAGHAAWLVMLFAWLLGAYAPAGLLVSGLTWLGATGLAAPLLAQTGLFVQGFALEDPQPTAVDGSPPPHGP